jgi:PAS domain S-box-containing protein
MRVVWRCALGLLLLTFAVTEAAAADAKRVLIVNSFGAGTPPFTTHSTAFEATLAAEMGEAIDLDEVSLGMARYAQPDTEEAFVQLLLKRLAKWQPDLVAPVGSPAGRFVVKYRDRLFPRTPVIYTGMDRRTLPPDLGGNATFVGENFDLPGLVEDILQLQPDTTNIVVVIGASPLEQFWTKTIQREFTRFSDRVTFTWLNNLSFEEMLRRVASLPPRSFILLALLVRDAHGVTYNQDQALQRLRAAANAPINGLFQNQLGLGIVGGRLYQAELEGQESARVAIRILRGEPVSSHPPRIIAPQKPRYDWRELQRWNIDEGRLPPGSVVEFREATVWAQYRGWIVGILVLGLVQAALIVQLAMNLTKRWRVERELRESEERVKLAAESARAGLWSLDLDTGQVWASPRLRELFRMGPADGVSYATFLAMVHPQDRERVAHAFDQSVGEGVELEIEYRIVRTDGSERWIGTRGHHDGGRGNGARRWSGASVDITERKLGEERLLESELRFRTVADSAPVLIWMAGVDKLCTFVNKAWLDFTGRTAEQEMGNGWTEGVHPDDLAGCLKRYTEAFDARRPLAMEYRVRRHDGEYRSMSDHGVPRYDAQGAFAGYIGSCSDITERLRAEEKFRQVFEAAPNAMIMVDERGEIVLVNAEAETVFGYPREELLGQAVETLVPVRLRRDHPTWRKDFQSKPETRTMGVGRNVLARRKDGSEVPVEVGLNPISTSEGLFIVVSVVDITERRRAEMETQGLRQDLAHISRVATMGELSAAIVHELSQPLTAIRTNAQAGLRLIASGKHTENDLGEILEDIILSDQHAGQVIQRLRSLFKKGDVERRPLLLNNLINDVISLVGSDARLRNVVIHLDLAPRLLLVPGDRVQLQQVLVNLVMNAFDAMADAPDRAGRLVVRTRVLGGRWVQVEVSDNGSGIPADKVGSIFDPFVTSKSTGMGMGLSVSRTIVRAHGGKIWAENDAAGGAAFRIVLPAVPGRDDPPPVVTP